MIEVLIDVVVVSRKGPINAAKLFKKKNETMTQSWFFRGRWGLLGVTH